MLVKNTKNSSIIFFTLIFAFGTVISKRGGTESEQKGDGVLMWWLFKKKKHDENKESLWAQWKSDFESCVAADYLPDYSVCQCEDNTSCRYLARYENMLLCSHPDHKEFIPEDAEPFTPHLY